MYVSKMRQIHVNKVLWNIYNLQNLCINVKSNKDNLGYNSHYTHYTKLCNVRSTAKCTKIGMS